jgi:plasmid stabilization system protein ParE
MAKAKIIDPFVSNGPAVEISPATSRLLKQRMKTADAGRLVPADKARQRIHPETTEQFADDLFDHIDLLQALPYIGTPVKGHAQVRRILHSPLYIYYRLDENRGAIEILHFWHSSRKEPRF